MCRVRYGPDSTAGQTRRGGVEQRTRAVTREVGAHGSGGGGDGEMLALVYLSITSLYFSHLLHLATWYNINRRIGSSAATRRPARPTS